MMPDDPIKLQKFCTQNTFTTNDSCQDIKQFDTLNQFSEIQPKKYQSTYSIRNIENKEDKNKILIFFDYCKKGYVNKIKQLFNKIDLPLQRQASQGNKNDLTIYDYRDAKDDIDQDCFYLACKNNQQELVDYFIEKQFYQNQKYINDNNIVIQMCVQGNLKMLQHLLIKLNLDINYKNSYGYTAFLQSCKHGYLDIVKFLHKNYKINIEQCNYEGNTGFILACKENHNQIAKFLIHNKVKLYQRNRKGYDGLYYAISNENLDLIQYIVNQNEKLLDQLYNNYESPLFIACKQGLKNVVKLLTKKSISLNCKNILGQTPFSIAFQNQYLDICYILLEANKFVDTGHYEIDIHQDIFTTKIRQDRQLLNHLNVINFFYSQFEYPIVQACKNKDLNKVEILLKVKGDVNEIDNEGNTPIIIACQNGDLQLLKLLNKYNADLSYQNYCGNCAVLEACKNNQINILRYLQEQNIDLEVVDDEGFSGFMYSCFYSCIEIMQFFIKNKTNIFLNTNNDFNSLMMCVLSGNLQSTIYILELYQQKDPKRINDQNIFGDTALILAFNYLIDKIDINITNNEGKTAFMCLFDFNTLIIQNNILIEQQEDDYYQHELNLEQIEKQQNLRQQLHQLFKGRKINLKQLDHDGNNIYDLIEKNKFHNFLQVVQDKSNNDIVPNFTQNPQQSRPFERFCVFLNDIFTKGLYQYPKLHAINLQIFGNKLVNIENEQKIGQQDIQSIYKFQTKMQNDDTLSPLLMVKKLTINDNQVDMKNHIEQAAAFYYKISEIQGTLDFAGCFYINNNQKTDYFLIHEFLDFNLEQPKQQNNQPNPYYIHNKLQNTQQRIEFYNKLFQILVNLKNSNVIHNNINPSNIFLRQRSYENQPFLVGFQDMSSEGKQIKFTSPCYEYIYKKHLNYSTHKLDVFSMAIIVIELEAGPEIVCQKFIQQYPNFQTQQINNQQVEYFYYLLQNAMQATDFRTVKNDGTEVQQVEQCDNLRCILIYCIQPDINNIPDAQRIVQAFNNIVLI